MRTETRNCTHTYGIHENKPFGAQTHKRIRTFSLSVALLVQSIINGCISGLFVCIAFEQQQRHKRTIKWFAFGIDNTHTHTRANSRTPKTTTARTAIYTYDWLGTRNSAGGLIMFGVSVSVIFYYYFQITSSQTSTRRDIAKLDNMHAACSNANAVLLRGQRCV